MVEHVASILKIQSSDELWKVFDTKMCLDLYGILSQPVLSASSAANESSSSSSSSSLPIYYDRLMKTIMPPVDKFVSDHLKKNSGLGMKGSVLRLIEDSFRDIIRNDSYLPDPSSHLDSAEEIIKVIHEELNKEVLKGRVEKVLRNFMKEINSLLHEDVGSSSSSSSNLNPPANLRRSSPLMVSTGANSNQILPVQGTIAKEKSIDSLILEKLSTTIDLWIYEFLCNRVGEVLLQGSPFDSGRPLSQGGAGAIGGAIKDFPLSSFSSQQASSSASSSSSSSSSSLPSFADSLIKVIMNTISTELCFYLEMGSYDPNAIGNAKIELEGNLQELIRRAEREVLFEKQAEENLEIL